MGQAQKRKLYKQKLLSTPSNLDVPLKGDDAFQVTLLATCEATINILERRLGLESDVEIIEARSFWIKQMREACEGLNATFKGYITEEFENKFKKYHKWVEADMNALLRDTREMTDDEPKYKGGNK